MKVHYKCLTNFKVQTRFKLKTIPFDASSTVIMYWKTKDSLLFSMTFNKITILNSFMQKYKQETIVLGFDLFSLPQHKLVFFFHLQFKFQTNGV